MFKKPKKFKKLKYLVKKSKKFKNIVKNLKSTKLKKKIRGKSGIYPWCY